MTNILLIDDHPIIRVGLKTFISAYLAHAVIDEAYDGDSAFKKIKEKEYQLIILDANMPNTDSFGLVANIIALKPDANILITLISASGAGKKSIGFLPITSFNS